jgi:3,4-dihydroxy 2-butanone 4-phosphate synthase / GTP cyclohydrolase II
MAFSDIDIAYKQLQAGKMLILVDDENRENEGDLIIAAEKVTPEAINFMAKYGRGLICLALAPEIVNRLHLPLMTTQNESRFRTNFTVSIEARVGVSTGISAYDRATTILAAIADNATASDLVMPGHVFPLCADEYGVLKRPGQTEGSVDLAKLANLKPAAVICEIMAEDGVMARMPALQKFAKQHDVTIVSIADLIKYRLRYDSSIIKRGSFAVLPTKYGKFTVVTYTNLIDGNVHIALIKGTIKKDIPVLVRVHSECLTGDVFGSERCDCGNQLQIAMQQIAMADNGAILYMRQEGRGIGLENKVHAYALQEQGYDTVEANHKLGFADDLRDYGICAQILQDLGVNKLKLLTNNPLKLQALNSGNLEVVEHVSLEVKSTLDNLHYLKTKKLKMGHFLKTV